MDVRAPALPAALTPLTALPAQDTVRGAHLRGLRLAGPAVARQEWQGCLVENCILAGDWERCGFTDTVFRLCDLSGMRGEGAALRRVALSECRLTGLQLPGAFLQHAAFTACRGDYLNLSGSRLDTVAWIDCRLADSAWTQVRWKRLTLRGCALERAVFHQTPLAGLDLREDTLDGWTVRPEDLRGLIVTPVQAAALARMLGLDIRDAPVGAREEGG